VAKVHFVSLGCPKNRVDAEHMLGLSVEGGHSIVEDPAEADAIVINTCGFIGEAKQESIEAILEMGAIKRKTGAKLVVSGCMAQRYAGELTRELPEVDAFLGTSDYPRIGEVLAPSAPAKRSSSLLKVLPDDAGEIGHSGNGRPLRGLAVPAVREDAHGHGHAGFLRCVLSPRAPPECRSRGGSSVSPPS